MADSDSHLGPAYGSGLAARTPSVGPSNRYSAEGTRSQDNLLSGSAVDNNSGRELGDSVPDAAPRVEERVAENPEHATNRELVSFEPELVSPTHPTLKDDLKYWPVILQWRAVTCLVLLYTATATAIGVLMWKSFQDSSHNFRLSSENVHMISRYFPSVIGTVTVLFFRQTVREALRMVPFVAMADQNGKVNKGAETWKGVGGAWFPWQDFTTTPGNWISFFSLICQFGASYIVSLKVALFANAPKVDDDLNEPYWVLTVRVYPAAALILGYIMMIIYTLYISWHFYGKSTGLKWDPVSIADYASLFAHCNALKSFAKLELRHDLRPKHVMSPDRCFRIGYWKRVRNKPEQTDIVYGIGVKYDGSLPHTETGISRKEEELGRPWTYVVTFRKNKPEPRSVDKCDRDKGCAQGTWPDCEHYPYNYNPGCARWAIALASLLPIGALALSIYALVIRLPEKGFSLPNNLKFPSTIYYGWDTSNHTLPPIDPADPKSTVLLWALMFRSAPTYVAGIFTSTIITWIDLNMRFMQPFRNMFGKGPEVSFGRRVKEFLGWPWWRRKKASTRKEPTPATAAESILLAYITVSPLQVPLTAWDKGHYKVCIYSTLSTLSPLFPIFVGGLLTVTPDGITPEGTYERVNFQFSLSAYIGIMVSLVLYSILLPMAMPGAYRLLPRQLYSLADLMAMCHESKFMASPHLDITDRERTPSKEHMEARLLLTDDRFLFGVYNGRDGHRHIGFDVAQEREPDFGPLKNVGNSVEHIPPEGFAARVQRTGRTMTVKMEEGLKKGKAMTGALTANVMSPFAQGRHFRSGDEQEGMELTHMSGGLGQPRASAEASGSQMPLMGSGSRTRPVRPDSLHG